MIGKLFTGKKVKHRGTHFTMESARLWTMPATPPPIYVATSGPIMAYRTGKFTDGLITVGAADEKLKMLVERYETGARDAGKDPATMPKMLQVKVSYAPTVEEATEAAVRDWPNGGMAFPKGDIREPEDFEAMAKLVRPDNYKNRVLIARTRRSMWLTYSISSTSVSARSTSITSVATRSRSSGSTGRR